MHVESSIAAAALRKCKAQSADRTRSQGLTPFKHEIKTLSTPRCENYASFRLHINGGVLIAFSLQANGAAQPRSTDWRSVPLAISEPGAKPE